ncbi:MFS transporter [Paenibacillus sp. MCAF20]
MPVNDRSQKLLFTIVTILYWTSMYTYVPILTPYLSGRGLSLQMIGIVLGSYGFVQMLGRFPLGIMSDKWGKRKPFVLLGMITSCISCLLFIVPGIWAWPLAGRMMAGVCASTWVAFTVLYASYFGAGQTGRAMGNISVMIVSGQMLGMVLSGWLNDGLGDNAPFITGAILSAIGLAASSLTASWFVKRFGYWGTIGLGFTVSSLCTASMAFFQSYEMLVITQAFNGFAQGLHLPLLLALSIRDVELPGRATAMGLYQALYAIGMFSGPFLAGWLNESWGLDSGFVFGAMLGAAAALLVWLWSSMERASARKAKPSSSGGISL